MHKLCCLDKVGYGSCFGDLEAQFFNTTADERIAEKCKEIPLGRLGTADEVANTVAFLASGESSYMTGQALNITGGQTMEL